MRQKPIHGISVHCTGVILLLHYLCTVQSKQGKANAALSIPSRPKLFCSSGFTFTWRTSTCTHPPTSRKTQHEMVIQFTVSFNTHPQLKKHMYQIPIFLQNSHRKTLIPVQHKIQAFSVLQTRKYKNTDFQLYVRREATNTAYTNKTRVTKQSSYKQKFKFHMILPNSCKYFPINVLKTISKLWNQAPRCICSPQSSFSEQLSNYSVGGRIVMTVSARTWWLFLFCGWSIFPFGMLKDFKRFFLPNRNTCLFYRWTQFNTIVFGLVA